MKKLLVLCLVGLMAFSSFSFADTSNKETENEGPGFVKVREEKLPKPKDPQERKEVYRERLSEIMVAYDVDLLDDFQGAWAVHDEIHVLLEARREEVLNALKAEKEIYKEMFESGEMTKEEIKAVVSEKRTEHQEERQAIDEAIQALKDAYGISEGAGRELHDALKAAVDEENLDLIYSSLENILEGLEIHTSFDQAKYELIINY